VAVQDINKDRLLEQLLADKQVLEWTGPKRVAVEGIDPESLEGLVADDDVADRTGFDGVSTSIGPFVGIGYRHDGDSGKGLQTATFRFSVKTPGRYELRMAYSAHSNRATNVPVTVTQNDTSQTVMVNQRIKPTDGPFHTITKLNAAAGEVVVTVSNAETDGYVLIDAMQLLPVQSRTR
jgi:hypothetical protein